MSQATKMAALGSPKIVTPNLSNGLYSVFRPKFVNAQNYMVNNTMLFIVLLFINVIIPDIRIIVENDSFITKFCDFQCECRFLY